LFAESFRLGTATENRWSETKLRRPPHKDWIVPTQLEFQAAAWWGRPSFLVVVRGLRMSKLQAKKYKKFGTD